MDNFKPLVWISLIGLFIAFGVICFLRFFFRKNPGLLRYKLRIGGIILTLTGMMTFTSCTVMCYVPAYNGISIVELDSLSYLNINQTNMIRFNLNTQQSIPGLSYQLQDSNGVFIESNDVQAFDGSFDSNTEEFRVYLPVSLTNGLYKLNCCTDSKTNQTADNWTWTYPFRVTNF